MIVVYYRIGLPHHVLIKTAHIALKIFQIIVSYANLDSIVLRDFAFLSATIHIALTVNHQLLELAPNVRQITIS